MAKTKDRTGEPPVIYDDPLMGRPYVVRNAYGTSIPHLDAADIRGVRIPRFDKADENAIADLMDESVSMSAEADRLENEATRLAQEQIDLAIAQLSDGK